MKNKKLLIAATAIFSLIVILSVFLFVWFWGDSYRDMDEFAIGAEIPGLDEGAAPQGLANYTTDYTDKDGEGNEVTRRQNYFFISAYMKDNAPSRIYVVGERTGYVGYVTLIMPDSESFYTGHCGGIATNGDTLWVSSDRTVFVAKSGTRDYNIATDVINKAANNTRYLNGEKDAEGNDLTFQSVKFTAKFAANCEASFLFYFDSASTDKLYVGEFYRKGNYETAKEHRLETPAGDKNTAFVMEYNVSTSSSYECGLSTINNNDLAEDQRVPQIRAVYSITGLIQGFALTQENQLVLSQSYGLAPSHLLYYDWSKVTQNGTQYREAVGHNFTYEGVTKKSGAPYTADSMLLYYVDGTSLVRDYTLPSMSEGLCVSNNKIHVLFESGCYKYKTFVRQITTNLYSFVPREKY